VQTDKHNDNDNDPGGQQRPRLAGRLLAAKNADTMPHVVFARNQNHTYTYYS
jgi:hypothetical protein